MRRDGEPESVPDMLSLFKGAEWEGPDVNSAMIYHFVEGETGEGRVWKAPKRSRGDNRYMLERLKPKITGPMRLSSAFSRAWSWIS